MARQNPRLHRLPQRLDYTLVPAPLDLSLPSITEKSLLPAIIVTPSSPVHTHDFSIAFLAPPPKPSLRERISSKFDNLNISNVNPSPWQSRFLRNILIIILLLLMILMHLILYQKINSDIRLDIHNGLDHQQLGSYRVVSEPSSLQPDINITDGEVKLGFWNSIGFELKNVWAVRGGVVIERQSVVVVLDDDGDSNEKPGSVVTLD